MPASLWGAESDVLQLGSFDPTESAILERQCRQDLAIVPLLATVADDPLHGLDLVMAGAALDMVSTMLHADVFSLKPELRLLAFFGRAADDDQPCNALAQPADPQVKNTFLIKFNVEGISSLKAFVERCVSGLKAGLRYELPGMGPATGHLMATSQCLQLAVELVLLHEVAHVVRNHLGQEDGFMQIPTVRRSLESDADIAAAFILNLLLPLHARITPPPGSEAKPALSWLLCGLLASFSMFSVLGEAGPLQDAHYHLEFTRLGSVADELTFGGSPAASRKLLPAILNDFKASNLVPEEHTEGEKLLREDVREFYAVTVPLRAHYQAQGRFNRWRRSTAQNQGG